MSTELRNGRVSSRDIAAETMNPSRLPFELGQDGKNMIEWQHAALKEFGISTGCRYWILRSPKCQHTEDLGKKQQAKMDFLSTHIDHFYNPSDTSLFYMEAMFGGGHAIKLRPRDRMPLPPIAKNVPIPFFPHIHTDNYL